MRLVYGIDASVARWVASRISHIGAPSEFGPHIAAGVVDGDDRPVAGVVWHGYRPKVASIELSAASDSPRWLSRRLIAEIFAYPFLFLKCRRVTTLTGAGNDRALAVNIKLGFTMEGRVRLGMGDDDMIIMGLLREEWLAGRFAPPRPVEMKEAA